MIKLFDFQEKEVRTVEVNGEIWFSGQDVFSILDLTWKGASELTQNRGIDPKRVIKRGTITTGGKQEMVFIDETALYKIAFRANKSQVADKFVDWVSELLVKLRKGELKLTNKSSDMDVSKHLDVAVQKDYSKQVNTLNFNHGGKEETIAYNVKNCELHTKLKPNQVIAIGKERGLKSKQCTSAKEVIRNLKPELSSAMSFTDKLVTENGVDHALAAKTSLNLALPLIKELMEITKLKEIEL